LRNKPQWSKIIKFQIRTTRFVANLVILEEWGVGFGIEIVRGAYLERERRLSAEGNNTDLTNLSFEATFLVYDRFISI
jgi:hypothetical protein